MKRIWRIIDKFIRKAGPYVPFYLENTILRSFGREGKSILDVGCGWGEPIKIMQLNKHGFHVIGVDIFRPYLKEAKRNKTHDEYVLGDVRKHPRNLCGEGINPYQEHKSDFLPDELRKKGYMVRGFGSKLNHLLYPYPHFKNVKRVLRVTFSPFSYYSPNFGKRMICVKKVESFSSK